MIPLAALYVGLNAAFAAYARRRAERGVPVELERPVSVVVPAWNVPDGVLEASLSSIASQTAAEENPGMVEIVAVSSGAVNEEILGAYADKVIRSPRGKLTARHLGILASRGDIIVSVDADAYYPRGWLSLVLEPFADPEVVGVTTCTDFDVMEPFVWGIKSASYGGRMLGRGSAFLRDAYFEVGGFDLSVNQFDPKELAAEEEWGFYDRLSKVGKVVLVEAPHYHLRPGTMGRI